jgi:hypothetical protein
MRNVAVIKKLNGSWLPILNWCEERFGWQAEPYNWYINYTTEPNFTVTLNSEEEVTFFLLQWTGKEK